MFASNFGVMGRFAYRIAGWLAANWVEGSDQSARPSYTLALLTTLAPIPAGAQTSFSAPATAEIVIQSEPAVASSEPSLALSDLSKGDLIADSSASSADIADAAPHQDFRFAARLAVISKLNAPSGRATRRQQQVAPARRAVPIAKTPEVKIVKDTRRPLAYVHKPTRKVKPSADVIEFAAAKSKLSSVIRRAA